MKHNWEYKRLGDVCEIINGFAFKSELFRTTGLPILRISNIQDNILDLKNLVYFKAEDYNKNLDKFLVKPQSILMALSGATTGKIGINTTSRSFYLNQRVALFKPLNINNLFLFHFLKTQVKIVLEAAYGAAQPNISSNKLEKLNIPLPPMEVQERIVAELDKINEVIEDCRELQRNLDALAQSIFYDFFGDPLSNPLSWPIKKLGDICEIYQPQTISTKQLVENGEYDVFGANGIIGKYNKYNHEFPEILLTCRGATCGSINVSNPKSWINGNAMVVHPKNQKLTLDFLKYSLKNLDYSTIITGAAQPQITRQSLAPTNIPIPPIELQLQFGGQLEKIEQMKRELDTQIADAQTLLDSRMDYWFN